MTLFDDTGALVYHMTGKGVVFRRRNFEGWRGEAKEKLPVPSRSVDFAFASAGRLGVATQDECFLSELAKGETPAAQGLVSKARGFLPRHPYHGGSGDHVNSNQLADVGTQFLHLARGDAPFIITGGVCHSRIMWNLVRRLISRRMKPLQNKVFSLWISDKLIATARR